MVRPISPPVQCANTVTICCSSSTATRVIRPKYGPDSRSAGRASSTPPTTASNAPKATQTGIGSPVSLFRIPAP